MRSTWRNSDKAQRALLILALLLALMAAIQANHRAGQGRSALLKWEPAFTALENGEPIYETGSEGYPTLPLSLLIMSPFRALGPHAGAIAWALFKIALAWWIVLKALQLAAGSFRSFPSLAAWIVVLLSFRVLLSDVMHGNTNIVIGATIVASACAWRDNKPLRAGLWIGLGAVLKVTPVLGLAYFLLKRSTRAVAGGIIALAVGTFCIPSLWVGWSTNLQLVTGWSRQMVLPYLTGRELTLTQTEHINQSLLGVLARLATDSVAIPAKPPTIPTDIYVNLIELSPAEFRGVHLALSVALVLLVAVCVGTRRRREGRAVLAEFSLLWLTMLFLSERSWKHHYVLLALPLALVAWYAAASTGPPRLRHACRFALVVSGALFGLSGSAVLGAGGSNLAEAWGVHLWGGLSLFTAAALCLIWAEPSSESAALATNPREN